jgi:hypothetical protein
MSGPANPQIPAPHLTFCDLASAHWPAPQIPIAQILYVLLVVSSSPQTRNLPSEPSAVDLLPHQQIHLLQQLPQSPNTNEDIPLSMMGFTLLD